MSADQYNSYHSEVVDLLPEYALGCLSQEEAAAVAQHLGKCAQCRSELRSFQGVVGALALAAPEVEPPADLRRKLLRRIQPVPPSASPERPQSWWQLLVTLLQKPVPAWGMASLAVVLMVVLASVTLWWPLGQQAAEEPGLRVIALAGTSAAPSARGLLVIRSDGEYGSLVVERLPTLDTEHQYQLWLIHDDQRTSGGVFSVGDDGYASFEVSAPEALSHYQAFGITVEPAGGSPGPTGQKVLGGAF